MATPISLNATTFEEAKADLEAWIQAKPDVDRWRDFLDSGAGTTITEMVAGLAVYNLFHSIAARRELYVDHAKLPNSLLALAPTLGYPVNRPTAAALRITATIDQNYGVWNKGSPIGSFRKGTLVLKEDTTLNEGTATFDVWIGEWKLLEASASSAEDFARVYIDDPRIENDLTKMLLTVSVDTPTLTAYPETLDPTSVLVRTCSGGVLIMFGDDYLGRKLLTEDYSVEYLSVGEILRNLSINLSEVGLFCGTPTIIEALSPGTEADGIKKLRTIMPGYFAARRRAVTAKDHIALGLAYQGGVVSANVMKKVGFCCTVEMVLLYDDEHILTTEEKEDFLEYMEQFKMAGETIEMVDAEAVNLNWIMTLITDGSVDQSDAEEDVTDIINEQTFQLGETFHVGQVVKKVGALPYVRRVYLQSPASDFKPGAQRYIRLNTLTLTVTSNANTYVSQDPDNEGFELA